MPEAAVVESEANKNITHSHAALGMGLGMIGGAILGAAIGVAIIGVAAAVTIFTGGLGAPTLIPALILAGSFFTGAYLGGRMGRIVGSHSPTDPKGFIREGEAAILLNGKRAATCGSPVHCDDHGEDKRVAEGSASVYFNNKPAARVGDKGECEFKISKGVGPIYVGGKKGGCGLTVGDEVPFWLRFLHGTSGVVGVICLTLAGGLGMAEAGLTFWPIVGRLLLGGVVTVGAAEGVGRPVGGAIGEAIDKAAGGDGSYGHELGGEIGSDAAAFGTGWGLGKTGLFEGPVKAPVVEPEVTPSLLDRATLNPEDIFPGQQTEANCAPQSCQQIVRVATGNNISEADMGASAQAVADYDPAVGTPADRVPDILNANGIPADTMPNTPESIQAALDQGRGVVSSHNAEDLWPGDPNFVDDPSNPISGGHAVHTIDVVRGPDGEVTGYVINDTGTGTAGRVVPADQYEGSLMDGVPATATNDPIYTPYQPAEPLAPGTAGDDPLGVTTPDTIQHVHEGGTVSDPQSPYDGKWDGKGLHDWDGLQDRVTNDGFKITDVQEDPDTGVRRVTVERSGDDPKIVNKNQKILDDPGRYPGQVVRDPRVTGEVTKTVYPKNMSKSDMDAAGNQALDSAVRGDPNTKIDPYGAKTKKDGSPADGYFESPVTTPDGKTIRVQGWFSQDAAGTQTITSHTPTFDDSWPSISPADW